MAVFRVLLFVALSFGFTQWKPGLFPTRDFVEYWSAATVLAHGGNPYDGEQLLKVQSAIDREEFEQRRQRGELKEGEEFQEKSKAVSLWTPPWTLPLYLPFGFLSFAVAHKVWLAVQLACLGAAVEMLAFVYLRGLTPPARLLPYLAVVLFSPVYWNLHFGQNTAFLILGLAGFARFRETRPSAAGAFAALTAIKPHLLAVFGIVLVLDAIRPAGRKALFAGAGMIVLGSCIALAFDPDIFGRFIEAVTRPSTPETVSLKDWRVPVFGYALRWAVDWNVFAWQFVPCAVACVATGLVFLAFRKEWDWPRQLPRLVVVSVLAAPYGGWIFDLTVLVLPLTAGAALALRSSPVGAAAYFAGMLVVSFGALRIPELAAGFWVAPAFAALHTLAEVLARHKDRTWRIGS